MTPKKPRGGARPGSGRKKGSGKGRKSSSATITMTCDLWAKLESIRGGKTRSRWIAGKIKSAKSPKP